MLRVEKLLRVGKFKKKPLLNNEKLIFLQWTLPFRGKHFAEKGISLANNLKDWTFQLK